MRPKIHQPLQHFLFVYFYIIEVDLNTTENELDSVKFQSEEANTDEYIKKYFKNYILKKNNISDTTIETLCIHFDNLLIKVDIESLKKFSIINVFLPEELSLKQKKEIAESKRSVYTSPDLYLEITDGKDSYFESLELKSTKVNNIPGSSIQQVNPYEWVIFVKRNEKDVTASTGFYINSITERLPFPDRSPRPQIGYRTLQDWNRRFRKEENNTLTFRNNSEINDSKIRLLDDWQDYLASEWLEIIKTRIIRGNEKWFNNAIRKFAVKFLEYTESLSNDEINELKEYLKNLIR